MSRVRRVLAGAPPWTGVGVVWVALVVGLALPQDAFFTYTNLTDILRNNSVPLLMAIVSVRIAAASEGHDCGRRAGAVDGDAKA